MTADLDGFRSFYENTIGLETAMVFGAGPGHCRQAILMAGVAMLHVFEVAGHDPTTSGFSSAMFERGRLDHLGFTAPGPAALTAIRNRLLVVDASSGDVHQLGPMLSVRFVDPDGLESEVNCFNPDFDPSTLRAGDEIVDPDWLDRVGRALRTPPDLTPHGAPRPAGYRRKSTPRRNDR
ncbi:MAG: VOC family protein [Pseudonocardia sp.]|nr:VOC family protein [Pseudonocardia sp.]